MGGNRPYDSYYCLMARLIGVFFFSDTSPNVIYTFPYTTLFRSLRKRWFFRVLQSWINPCFQDFASKTSSGKHKLSWGVRSEEHTSELQSLAYLVCRLLLEKKKMRIHCPRDNRLDGASTSIYSIC